jgi:transposase
MRTTEEKRRIVRETLVPGTSVAEVARRHGVNANLLFGWRRQHEQGVLAEHTRSRKAKLLPVKVSAPVAAGVGAAAASIEIDLPSGVKLRVNGEIAAQQLVVVLSALGER